MAFYRDALDDQDDRHPELAPLLHHSECYEFVGEWYLKNLFGNLHAQQDWELFAPIRVGTRVRSVSTIVDRYHKRGRDYVLNETDFDANDSRLLVRSRTHQSFLPPREKSGAKAESKGEGFVVDEKTASRKKTDRLLHRDGRRPRAGEEAHRPASLDVLGTRRELPHGPRAGEARLPEHRGTGMMSTCFVSAMQRAFDMGWLVGGRMSLKLTNVLWVDEDVVARGRIREGARAPARRALRRVGRQARRHARRARHRERRPRLIAGSGGPAMAREPGRR